MSGDFYSLNCHFDPMVAAYLSERGGPNVGWPKLRDPEARLVLWILAESWLFCRETCEICIDSLATCCKVPMEDLAAGLSSLYRRGALFVCDDLGGHRYRVGLAPNWEYAEVAP